LFNVQSIFAEAGMGEKSKYLKGDVINPAPIEGNVRVIDLVEKFFSAYNAKRLKEACLLFATKMLKEDVTVGMSL
jgi:deoxyhypusine synthase